MFVEAHRSLSPTTARRFEERGTFRKVEGGDGRSEGKGKRRSGGEVMWTTAEGMVDCRGF